MQMFMGIIYAFYKVGTQKRRRTNTLAQVDCLSPCLAANISPIWRELTVAPSAILQLLVVF